MSGDRPPVEFDAAVEAGAGIEVAVVGAGAVGATTAYDLARQGAAVTIYDRGSVAGGASGRAAGICYDAFADSPDAAIGREAIERFRALSGDDTFPFVECPYVWFAREGDDETAAAIRDGVTRMQARGVVAVEMDAETLADRFPAIRPTGIETAAVAGAAGYADPAAYTDCLVTRATDAGGTLRTETPVAVRTDPPRVLVGRSTGGDGSMPTRETAVTEREFDAVVVAAGAHTKRVLADAGVAIAMKPYRVQALTASAAGDGGRSFAEPMCYDATGDWYVRPHEAGVLAGDGTEPVEVDPDEWNRDPSPGFAVDLVERISARFPDFDPGVERAWAGVCTATPDRNPLVGVVREGVYVATGFHGQGFMRAPAIGRRLADAVLAAAGVGGEGGVDAASGVGTAGGVDTADGVASTDDTGGSTFELAAYDPGRFDGDERFDIVE